MKLQEYGYWMKAYEVNISFFVSKAYMLNNKNLNIKVKDLYRKYKEILIYKNGKYLLAIDFNHQSQTITILGQSGFKINDLRANYTLQDYLKTKAINI